MKLVLVRMVLSLTLALPIFSCGHSPKPELKPAATRTEEPQASARTEANVPPAAVRKDGSAAGDFPEALAEYANFVEKHPVAPAAPERIQSAVERIKAEGDRRFAARDFARAEETYGLLAAGYPKYGFLKKSLSFGPDHLNRRIQECRKLLSEPRARDAMARGEYLTALDSYKVLSESVLRNPAQAATLRQIMDDIWDLANKSLARDDLVSAGKGFAVLWREYPLAEKAGLVPSFSRGDAESELKACRSELTRRGLDQYRKSNLKEAISIWQGLLQFDPDNGEIRKAVETAAAQLKKLEKYPER